MIPADTLGWIAAALMVATFSCRDPLWMRPLAVCTNLAFIAYACIAGLAPVLALHALLLPINLMRWWQSAREYRWARRLGLAAVFTVAAVATAGFSTDAVPDQVLFTAIK
jgi:hypothetical protein